MSENHYIFLQKKSLIISLNHYLTHVQTPCFIVNHFAHLYVITEFFKKTSPIVNTAKKNNPFFSLLSPPNAVSYMGVRWWLTFMDKAVPILSQYTITHILDCYDHAGLAMAALRAGQKHILFESSSTQFQTLKNRAQTVNAIILDTRPQAFNLLKFNFKKNPLAT